MTIVHKLWGWEKIIENSCENGYCLKELTVKDNGKACSVHYHKRKVETFYITSGLLYLEVYSRLMAGVAGHRLQDLYNRHLYALQPGTAVTLSTLVPHRFWAHKEEAVFIEGSMFDSPEDSIRIVNAGDITADFEPGQATIIRASFTL